jgi:hypothetical protein
MHCKHILLNKLKDIGILNIIYNEYLNHEETFINNNIIKDNIIIFNKLNCNINIFLRRMKRIKKNIKMIDFSNSNLNIHDAIKIINSILKWKSLSKNKFINNINFIDLSQNNIKKINNFFVDEFYNLLNKMENLDILVCLYDNPITCK